MSKPVIIVDYDPTWWQIFAQIAEHVSSALGGLALAIEHVGSTSVPGLAAKPIIDIDVVISSRDLLPDVVQRLAAIGYVHQGDLGITGREAFERPPGTPNQHLYVCAQDNRAHCEHILFRDYLRAHPEAARQYGELKKRLAHEYGSDRDGYTNAKTEFVQGILEKAKHRER